LRGPSPDALEARALLNKAKGPSIGWYKEGGRLISHRAEDRLEEYISAISSSFSQIGCAMRAFFLRNWSFAREDTVILHHCYLQNGDNFPNCHQQQE
jgi:hypothetical protein